MGKMHIGQFGVGSIDFEIDQTHMAPNNQPHVFINSLYMMSFLNAIPKIHVEGSYNGQ